MRKGIVIIGMIFIAIAGCKKDKSADPEPPVVVAPVITPPGKAVLVSPAKNEACLEGASVSASQSMVTFKWEKATAADNYDLVIKDLLTNTVKTYNNAQPLEQLTLSKNTPYSWYVVSKSAKTSATAQSESWKFYNAAEGKVFYAPFPAEMTSPVFGEIVKATNSRVTLKWKGSDVDNDISSYTVYFGNSATPAILKSDITENELSAIVVAGTTYYWKVITKDVSGNTSDSGIFQFSVN